MLPHAARRRALALAVVWLPRRGCLAATTGCASTTQGPTRGAAPVRAPSSPRPSAARRQAGRPRSAAQPARHRDRRHAVGRPAIHAARAPADPGTEGSPSRTPSRRTRSAARRGSSFMTGEYAHNHQVLQPRRAPTASQAFHDRHTIATVLQGVRGTAPRWSASTSTATASSTERSGQSRPCTTCPPGGTSGTPAPTTCGRLDEPELRRRDLHLLPTSSRTSTARSHAFPGRYSTDVLADQARGVIDGFSQEQGRRGSCGGRRWRPHYGTPVEPDDPAALAARRRSTVDELGHAGATQLGQGSLRQRRSPTGRAPRCGPQRRGRREGQAALPAQACPSSRRPRRRRETELTRQRAESLYALDVQVQPHARRPAAAPGSSRTR